MGEGAEIMNKQTYTFYFTCMNCGEEHMEEIKMGKDAIASEVCPYCGNYYMSRFRGHRNSEKQSHTASELRMMEVRDEK